MIFKVILWLLCLFYLSVWWPVRQRNHHGCLSGLISPVMELFIANM